MSKAIASSCPGSQSSHSDLTLASLFGMVAVGVEGESTGPLDLGWNAEDDWPGCTNWLRRRSSEGLLPGEEGVSCFISDDLYNQGGG